jgi:hypothetical protein
MGNSCEKNGFLQAVRDFLFGFVAYGPAQVAMKTRANMEDLFMIVTVGGMLGIPIFSSYYSLGFLPYMVPRITTWKRRLLREKDFTDILEE